MFPYLLLIVATITFSHIATGRTNKKAGKIYFGNSEYVKNNNLGIFAFFLTLFCLLACRDISIGRDLQNYKYYFLIYKERTFSEIISREGEQLFFLLNWFVGKFTSNYQVYLTIVAAVTIVPIYKQYAKEKRCTILKIVIFMNLSVFVMLFSGLRQSLAISLGMIAYEFVKEKKLFPFLLISIMAFGIHHSGFIVFLLYPVYHMRLNKKHMFFIVPIVSIIFLFNRQIFGFLTYFLYGILGEKYETIASSTGAYTMIVLFAVFVGFSYIIPDESKMDEESYGLRNYLLIALIMQCFAPVHSLAMRINYYFIVFIPMAIPKMIIYSKQRYKKVVKFAEVFMVLFFTSYYLFNTYKSCVTGISVLDTYPYAPFWRK